MGKRNYYVRYKPYLHHHLVLSGRGQVSSFLKHKMGIISIPMVC